MAGRAGTGLVEAGWPLTIVVTAAETGARVRITCTVDTIRTLAGDHALEIEVGDGRFTPLPAREDQ